MEISVDSMDVSAACFSARNSARAAAVDALSDKSSSSVDILDTVFVDRRRNF